MCKLNNLFRAISKGNLKLVTEILSTQNIIDQDWNDYKLLLLALEQNQKEIAKILLDHGCRVQDPSKKDFSYTPIYYVIKMQDSEMIQLILNKNFSFNSIDYKFQSPFEIIIQLNDREVLKKILSAYVNENINPTDYAGFSPFLIACYVGDTTIVKYFLNIDQSIINHRVKDSAKKFPGFSPLHFAIKSGNLQTIEILLSHGVDITLKNKSGMSAFHLACVNKNEQIRDLLMKILFERNAHYVQDEGFSVVFKNLNHNGMIQLNRKYEENGVAWDSWTPLHYAVTLRKIELIELLLKKKANVDAKNDKGLAPLHLACQCTLEELSKTISTNNEGINFIMYVSCHYKLKAKIRILLAMQDQEFFFPGFINFEENLIVNPDIKKTVIEKRKQIIRLLLRHGAEVNIADNIGATPLHDLLVRDFFFEESDKIEIIEEILNKGADVNAKTRDNVVPLYLALRFSFLDVSRILIDHNADVISHMEAPVRTNYESCIFRRFMPDKQQKRFSPITVLLYNARNVDKKLSILKLMLEKGADPNMRFSSGANVLNLAIQFLDEEHNEEVDRVVLTLLQFGVEINSKDSLLRTPLHYACSWNNYCTTSTLLKYGADINAVDIFNGTPLSYATNPNKNFFSTIKQHVLKLKHIGLYVSQQNEKCLQELEEICAKFFPVSENKFLEQCAEEVDRLKKTKINKYTALYDILLKDENDLVAHVNDTFKEIVESNDFSNKFQIYGFLLKLKYEKSLKRKLLVDEAEKALKFFTKWKIPDLCIRMIIAHLNNANLQALTKAYATNINDAHLSRSRYKKCNSLLLLKRKR